MAGETLQRTPLYDEHTALGARLVPFAGYEMPVQYEGITVEHEAVRNHAGLFDVSHMGEVFFRGPQAEEAVQRLVTRDVSRLDVGQAGYAAVCLPNGGTVDDVLVYRRPEDFLVVVNASNREKDLDHFGSHTGDLDVEIVDESDDWALLALQGPEAEGILQNFTDADLSALRYYRYETGEVGGYYAFISRTGYTGEDGFERRGLEVELVAVVAHPSLQHQGVVRTLTRRDSAGLDETPPYKECVTGPHLHIVSVIACVAGSVNEGVIADYFTFVV